MTNELTPALHQLAPGAMLRGRYRLGQVLGEGGFGITYEGYDTELELRVAVKEYYPTGFATREVTSTATVQPFAGQQGEYFSKGLHSFIDEARRLARLSSLPGIAAVRDFFQENGTAYIVMEFIDGQTFKQYLQSMGGSLLPVQVFEMMMPVMQSLAAVHKNGIIHRDISPGNIMISRDGYMKLLDFGSAREFSGDQSMSVLLTPGYAPEEQYRRKGAQGPWTDVYSLCATMYRAIVGTAPDESIERLHEDTLRPPSAFGIAMPPTQEAALMKGLALRAEDRWQDMTSLMAAIEPGYAAAVTQMPTPMTQPESMPQPIPMQQPMPMSQPMSMQQPMPMPLGPLVPMKEKTPFVWPLSKKLTAILAGALAVVIAAVCIVVPLVLNRPVYVEAQRITLTYPSGRTYEGLYTGNLVKDQPKDDDAVFDSDSGWVYTGAFANGLENGRGVQINSDGSRLEGEWKNGFQSGTGTVTNPYGRVIGEWKIDAASGQATIPYGNGDKYAGGWIDGGGSNGQGTYTYKDGGTLEGEWKNDSLGSSGTVTDADGKVLGKWEVDAANGWATIPYPDGNKYTGEWKDGIGQYGQGTMAFADGGEYIGEWKQGMIHGQGVLTDENGGKCEGQWKYNLFSGHGTTTDADGKVLGEWEVDETAGRATIFYSDGGEYAGAWKVGLGRHGYGATTYEDGSKYTGEWKYNAQNGKGIQTGEDGGTYDGEFMNGWPVRCKVTDADGKVLGENTVDISTGQATLYFTSGGKYVGAWMDGQQNGQGKYTWAEGDEYTGNFKDGSFDGQGSVAWANGTKYTGEWKNGKYNGQGTYTESGGFKYVGNFRDNNFSGQGTATFGNGDKYVGDFEDDTFNGEGTYTFADGDKYVGHFKDGKRDGYGTYTFASGTVRKGQWKNGDFVG